MLVAEAVAETVVEVVMVVAVVVVALREINTYVMFCCITCRYSVTIYNRYTNDQHQD